MQKYQIYSCQKMFALCCIIILLVIGFLYIKKIKYRSLNNVPSPPEHPVLGHFSYLKGSTEDVLESLFSLNEKYGPVVKLWANPLKPMLVVTDPKIIEFVLNGYLDKSSLYACMKPYFGNALTTSSVDKWRKDRKVMNPLFHPKALEDFIGVFDEHANKLVGTLRSLADKQWVDLPEHLEKFSLDVICNTFFRVKTNFQEFPNTEYVEARNGFLQIFIKRAFSHLRTNEFLFRISKMYDRQTHYIKTLKGFSQYMLETRRKQRNLDEHHKDIFGEYNVLLDMVLDINSISDTEIIDHINMFLTAGHASPASLIGFALYEISKHPMIQAKLVEELVSIFGKNKDALVTYKDMQEMKYMECVIKETLRLNTPLPIIERSPQTDVNINGLTIPKGIDVAIPLFALHRDERYHPEPTKFDPDRFKPGNAENIQPNTFIPFSSGPRNCIGQQFGIMEAKITIAKILLNFELLAVDHKVKYTTKFVLASATGLPLQIKQRML